MEGVADGTKGGGLLSYNHWTLEELHPAAQDQTLPSQFFRANKKRILKTKRLNLGFRKKVSKIGEILINDSSMRWIWT